MSFTNLTHRVAFALLLLLLAIGTAPVAVVGYLLVDFFERVDDFIEHQAPISQYVLYFACKTPMIVVQIAPMAVLMGVFMTLGGLSRTNELTAMRAGGISLWRITIPLLATALLITGTQELANEYVVPLSSQKINYILHTQAGGKPNLVVKQDHLWFREGNSIVNVRLALPEKNALQGVTIDLKTKTKTDEPQHLVISTNTAGTTDKIKEWVDSYNSLLDTFNSLSKFTPVKTGEAPNPTNGPLLGDNTLRGIQSSIKSALSAAQDNPELKGLGNLGISTNTKTGKLEIDSAKLKKAMDEKPDQVSNFFVGNGKDTGMATEIHNEIQNYIKSGGIIENSTKSINTNLDRLNSQITTVTASIQNTIDRYKQQFVQLDTMMSKMNGTSNYLAQQFK